MSDDIKKCEEARNLANMIIQNSTSLSFKTPTYVEEALADAIIIQSKQIKQLTADRSAFAEETEKYRSVWLRQSKQLGEAARIFESWIKCLEGFSQLRNAIGFTVHPWLKEANDWLKNYRGKNAST